MGTILIYSFPIYSSTLSQRQRSIIELPYNICVVRENLWDKMPSCPMLLRLEAAP